MDNAYIEYSIDLHTLHYIHFKNKKKDQARYKPTVLIEHSVGQSKVPTFSAPCIPLVITFLTCD